MGTLALTLLPYVSGYGTADVADDTDEVTDFGKAEMQAIAGIEKQCRLIKGQVFLWEGARGWEDLWDLDGTIVE